MPYLRIKPWGAGPENSAKQSIFSHKFLLFSCFYSSTKSPGLLKSHAQGHFLHTFLISVNLIFCETFLLHSRACNNMWLDKTGNSAVSLFKWTDFDIIYSAGIHWSSVIDIYSIWLLVYSELFTVWGHLQSQCDDKLITESKCTFTEPQTDHTLDIHFSMSIRFNWRGKNTYKYRQTSWELWLPLILILIDGFLRIVVAIPLLSFVTCQKM